MIRHCLDRDDFVHLIRGGEIELVDLVTDEQCNLILADIGWLPMMEELTRASRDGETRLREIRKVNAHLA